MKAKRGDENRKVNSNSRPKENKVLILNHRTVIGRRRRAKMETKILGAALRVFGEKGRDAPVIDDFIKAAGISRGTFYNYFKSTGDLLEATSNWLSEDVQSAIDDDVCHIGDPALRHCTAMRLWMRRAEIDAVWCAFVARVWFTDAKAASRDIRAALKAGRFRGVTLHSAEDLSLGTLRQAMLRLLRDCGLRGYGDEVVRGIMRGLGVKENEIEEMMTIPLPELRAFSTRA